MKWYRWFTLSLLLACSADPNALVFVTVDAETGIRADSLSFQVRVYGGERQDALTLIEQANYQPEDWGRTFVLTPLDHEISRIYRVELIAYELANGSGNEVARTNLVSGYVEGESRSYTLFLYDICSAMPCEREQACDARGMCVTPFVPPSALPARLPDAGAEDMGLEPGDAGADTATSGDGGPLDATTDTVLDATADMEAVPDMSILDAAADMEVGTDMEVGPICNAETCTSDSPCIFATCEGSTCVRTNAPLETVCDDGDACTTSDHCLDGLCVGTAMVCSAIACQVGMCTEGTCAYVNSADGFPCDDGVSCSRSDECQAGVCSGTPFDEDCNDDNICTNDVCGPAGCTHTNNTARCGTDPCGALICLGGLCPPPGPSCGLPEQCCTEGPARCGPPGC